MEVIELDGVSLKFVKLTLSHEDEWKTWLRARMMADAKRDADELELIGDDRLKFLSLRSEQCAAGLCGLITPLGMQHASTTDGMKQILRMASAYHHPTPGIDEETLMRVIVERHEDLPRVLSHVLPGRREKKAPAGRTDTQPGTPT